jgi:methanogenic corrinoid protein MtbC1
MAHDLEAALLALDRLEVRRIVDELAGKGSPIAALQSVVAPALERIGERWSRGEVSLSQVYMSGRICEEAIGAVLPRVETRRGNGPLMAITVLEDYHMLGKRLVASVLRSSGYDLLDYGRTTVSELASRVREDAIQILLVSTLMLPAALRVRALRDTLRDAGSEAKIVVGGAPFRMDDALWREVGADAMGRTASDSIEIVARLSGGLA